jgi:hypothetical protein
MYWRLAALLVSLGLGACSSTYHPEYHPVVYTSQQVTYPPVDVPSRPVVVVSPPPAPAPALPPPPPEFFNPQ